MSLKDIQHLLSAAGIYSILVESVVEKSQVKGLLFGGDLAQFIETVVALGQRCVFISSRMLTLEDFLYTDEDAEPDTESDDFIPPVLDLVNESPKLCEYKAHLNDHCANRLWVWSQYTTLEIFVMAPWWEPFEQLRNDTILKIQAGHRFDQAKERREVELQRDKLLKQLRGLIGDPKFVQLTTQIAMQAYAVDVIPELETLGVPTLKLEVQNLDAKIKAKGLRGKKS